MGKIKVYSLTSIPSGALNQGPFWLKLGGTPLNRIQIKIRLRRNTALKILPIFASDELVEFNVLVELRTF